jgi:uncharacterized membrane protein
VLFAGRITTRVTTSANAFLAGHRVLGMRRLPARIRSRATGVTSLIVLGVGLTALFLGMDWFWVVFVVGFAVVVPLVSVLVGADERDAETAGETRSASTPADPDDPLATLRGRYARGELTEEQFERKLEALLETETLEAAEDRARRRDADRDRESDAEHEIE